MRRLRWLLGCAFAGLAAAAACGGKVTDDEASNASGGSRGPASLGGTTAAGGSAGGSGGTSSPDVPPPSPPPDDELEALSQCTAWAAEPEPMSAGLFMVIDASSAMRDPPPEGGSLNKWEVTRDSLIAAVHELTDDTALGMLAFPNKVIDGTSGDPSMCVNVDAVVPLGVLGQNDHRRVMIDAINAVETNTCTPTHDAYTIGLAEVVTAPIPGQKYMLLMHGAPPTLNINCEPGQCTNDLPGSEQPVIDEIAAAHANYGIKTFVLGLPHSEGGWGQRDARWWLSQAAELGGTSQGNCSHEAEPYCHFDLTGPDIDFAEELNNALRDIVAEVTRCDYALPLPPPGESIDLDMVNLIVRLNDGDPILILRNAQPGCEQGWYLDEASSRVSLCSETCAVVRSDPNASLELRFGCPSEDTPD